MRDRGIGQSMGSHEELLEEVLGKQILQVVVDALVLVRRTRLAHTKNWQAEVLDLDARLCSCSLCVLAALRVPFGVRASMIMMVSWWTNGLGLV